MAPSAEQHGSQSEDPAAQAAATDMAGDLRGASIDQRRLVASEQVLVAYQISGAILEATREQLPLLAEEHRTALFAGAEVLRQSVIHNRLSAFSGSRTPEDATRLICASCMECTASLLMKLGDASDTRLLLALNGSALDLRTAANDGLTYARQAGMLITG